MASRTTQTRTNTTTLSSTWVTDGTAHGHADQAPAAAAYARDYRAAVLSGGAGGDRVDRAPAASRAAHVDRVLAVTGGGHVDRGRAPWSPGELYPLNTFGSGDRAKETLYEYAIRNGFALVTKRSSKSVITLACSQGGDKRSHRAGGFTSTEGVRALRTKKIGCNYTIQLHRSDSEGWRVVDGVFTRSHHSPQTAESMSALPAARRFLILKHGVASKIDDDYDPRTPASAVWTKLRKTHSWLTFKDVDNILCAIKKKQLNGLTEIEALHAKLKAESVTSDSLRDEENRLVRLFFAPNASKQLTQVNANVLLLDCTYKTNTSMMPLLHVVGVTGTHKQFTVACCFMDNEQEDSYVWALEKITRASSHWLTATSHERIGYYQVTKVGQSQGPKIYTRTMCADSPSQCWHGQGIGGSSSLAAGHE